jgi:hypothetical protein
MKKKLVLVWTGVGITVVGIGAIVLVHAMHSASPEIAAPSTNQQTEMSSSKNSATGSSAAEKKANKPTKSSTAKSPLGTGEVVASNSSKSDSTSPDANNNSTNSNSASGNSVSSSSDSCALPKYPKPSCTGVPAGVTLTDLPQNDGDGNYVVNTPGAVIDGKHITGSLLIKADNVTIKNSQIDDTVYNWFGNGNSFTITDSTIGPANGCIGQPGIVDHSYTAVRVKIRGHDDGFRVGEPGNVTVRDSYASLCYLPPEQAPPDGSHSDGIQAYCGSSCINILLQHNTIDARSVPATFMINMTDSHAGAFVGKENLLMGGAYVITTTWYSGVNYIVSDNRIVKDSWAYGPASGEGTCGHQTWSGNTIVTINNDYNVTSTVSSLACP